MYNLSFEGHFFMGLCPFSDRFGVEEIRGVYEQTYGQLEYMHLT